MIHALGAGYSGASRCLVNPPPFSPSPPVERDQVGPYAILGVLDTTGTEVSGLALSKMFS
jgi:hypothetical protein